MDFINILEHSYKIMSELEDISSKAEYVSEHIFGFCTYDQEVSETLTGSAIDVAECISKGETFAYQEAKQENYLTYIIMCNMRFFYPRLNWGTSIRGTWWDHKDEFILESCGIFDKGGKQIEKLRMTRDEWIKFTLSLREFVSN